MRNLNLICFLILFFAILLFCIVNSKSYDYIINNFFIDGQAFFEDNKKSNNLIKNKKLDYIFKYNPPKNLLENSILLQILFFIIGLNIKASKDLFST